MDEAPRTPCKFRAPQECDSPAPQSTPPEAPPAVSCWYLFSAPSPARLRALRGRDR